MPADEVAKLRNVAVVGQGGAGKTTVADALLFAAGAGTRLGRVDDRTSALDIAPALKDAEAIGAKPALLQLPIGREAEFRGVVDLLSGRAYLYQGESGVVQEAPPPAELADEVRAARERLVETIAEANDALLEKYLEGVELSADELGAALRDGVRAGKFVPVLCGAAGPALGLHPLLDAIVDLLPSPADLKPWEGDNPKTGDRVEDRKSVV